jgi:hypothetical protein
MTEKVGSAVVPSSPIPPTGDNPKGSEGYGWNKKTLALAATGVLIGGLAGLFIGQGSRRSDSEARADIYSAKVNVVKDARSTVAVQKRELQAASRQRVNAAFRRGSSKGYPSGVSAGRAAADKAVADSRSKGQSDGYSEGYSRGLADWQAYDYTTTTYCDPTYYYC